MPPKGRVRGSCAVLRCISAASSWPGRAAWAKRRSPPPWPGAARAGLSHPDRRGRGQERAGRAVRREPPSATTRSCSPPAAGPTAPAEVRARTLTPDDALARVPRATTACSRISQRLVSQRRARHGGHRRAGHQDILVLGKVKQLERARRGRPDRARRPGRRPRHHLPAVGPRACSTPCGSGPINTQARTCSRCSPTPTRCQVVLVTLPEETPVNELVETAFSLEDRVGVSLGPVVVNGLYPDDRRPRRRPRRGRRGRRRQPARRARPTSLARRRRASGATASTLQPSRSTGWPSGCPLPQLRLPFLFDAELGPAELDAAGRRALGSPSIDGPPGRRPRDARRATVADARLVDAATIVVCCGSGGVGKTTTAAVHRARGGAPGPAGRRRHHRPGQAPGRRPRARRAHGNTPSRIDGDVARRAVGADARHQDARSTTSSPRTPPTRSRPSASSTTASTATSPARCRARRSTWRWRSSTSCTTSTDFDLVVVDTPPTRNALDFLDAPAPADPLPRPPPLPRADGADPGRR